MVSCCFLSLYQRRADLFSPLLAHLLAIAQNPPVQFFSWTSWFPVLFYSTTYITEILYTSLPSSSPPPTPDEATRLGSLALLLYAIVALVSGSVLPLLSTLGRRKWVDRCVSRRSRTGRVVRRALVGCSLRNFWTAALGWFAMVMVATFWVRSVRGAMWVVAALGVPWSVTCWVSGGSAPSGGRRKLIRAVRTPTGPLRPRHGVHPNAPRLSHTHFHFLLHHAFLYPSAPKGLHHPPSPTSPSSPALPRYQFFQYLGSPLAYLRSSSGSPGAHGVRSPPSFLHSLDFLPVRRATSAERSSRSGRNDPRHPQPLHRGTAIPRGAHLRWHLLPSFPLALGAFLYSRRRSSTDERCSLGLEVWRLGGTSRMCRQ